MVRNSARPMIAIVGGMFWVVSARRMKARTMTILVNDVIITSRLGRRASPAKTTASRTGLDQSGPGWLGLGVEALSNARMMSPISGTDEDVGAGAVVGAGWACTFGSAQKAITSIRIAMRPAFMA